MTTTTASPPAAATSAAPAPVQVSVWAGAGVVESVADLAGAVGDGRWMDAALSGVGAVADVGAAASDPVGELLGAGLGWLIEHLDPLHGWLTDLTGDAGAVSTYCETWRRLAQDLAGAADELDRVVHADLTDMTGDAVDAYRARTQEMSRVCRGLAANATAITTGLGLAATIVQIVHDLVRDALAKVVGAAISWAAELACTAGLAAPLVAEQVTTRVAALATSVGTHVTATITSSHALRDLLTQLSATLGTLGHGLHAATAIPPHRAPHTDLTHGAEHATTPVLAPPMPPRDTATPRASRVVAMPSRLPDPSARPAGSPARFTARDDVATALGRTRENEVARALSEHGYDMRQNPPFAGPKRPDYLIEGQIFDCLAPTTSRARNVWDRVLEKISAGQTSRVVLCLDDCPVPLEDIRAQFHKYPIDGLEQVIVVQHGKVVEQDL